MKILAIDTSTKFLILGLYDGAKSYEYRLETGARLSSVLHPIIKSALGALNWDIGKIDYFACGLGPGSFTGIRIGVAAIKGLAWALKKPVLGISTLDILAENALLANKPVRQWFGFPHSQSHKYIIPVIDARRNLIYAATYKRRNNTLKRLTPFKLFTLKEFYAEARPESTILGDALGLYKEDILRNVKGAKLLDKDYWQLRPGNLIKLALEQVNKRNFSDAFEVKPVYLYPKECQIRK